MACGACGPALCRAARIEPASLAEGRRRVAWRSIRTLFAEAERQTSDPLVGLRAGLATRARGLIRYAQMSAETIEDGLALACRLVGHGAEPLRMELERGRWLNWLHLAIEAPPHATTRLVLEYLAAFQIRLLEDVGGERFRPVEVRFPHAPAAPRAAYERALEVPVRFRQPGCAIAIRDDTLKRAIPTANARLSRLVCEEIEAELRANGSASFRRRVERSLGAGLAGPVRGSRSRVASLLGVSVRTLQRRLAQEGVTFREARVSVQRTLAEEMLESTPLSISKIAGRLGFADAAAFGKAFRRWTGRTPGEQRTRGRRGRKMARSDQDLGPWGRPAPGAEVDPLQGGRE